MMGKRCGSVLLRKWFTFHLSGTPIKAAGSLFLSVFWVIVEVMATPQTVPRERIK